MADYRRAQRARRTKYVLDALIAAGLIFIIFAEGNVACQGDRAAICVGIAALALVLISYPLIRWAGREWRSDL